jgi:hypothetical protein
MACVVETASSAPSLPAKGEKEKSMKGPGWRRKPGVTDDGGREARNVVAAGGGKEHK